MDRATYRDPYQESAGIEHVVVNGVHLVQGGTLAEGLHPGQRLTSGREQ
jgi:dihydroorotase